MEFYLIHKLIVFLISIIALGLGGVIYFNNPKGRLNKIFLLMVFLMLVWVIFAFLARLFHEPLFLKIAWFATPLFFTCLYFLVIYLLNLNKEKGYRFLNKVIWIIGGIIAIITGFTDLIIEEVKLVNGDFTIIYGIGMWFFLGVGFFLICATLYPLIKSYLKSSAEAKKKIEYLLVGIFIFYLGNLIFNITLPIFFGVARFYYLGDYSAIFLLGFTGYAIIKRELFEIKIVLTQFLVGLIAILLAVDLFVFTPQLSIQIFKSLVLIIFLYFGWLLIKNVKKEIQQRRKMEVIAKQLQETNKELKVKSKKLKKAYGELKKLDNMKSSFIAITSHQLRTPLTAIKGYVSMILEEDYGKVPKKIEQPMKNVYQSNERLIGLVNDLLNISKINANKVQLELKQACLEEIIIGIIKELENEAKIRNIFLKFEKPKKILPKVLVDSQKIRQIILNVIDNAIKYTEKGEVVVSISKQGNNYQIKIKDTGIGITREDIYSIFQGFYRGKDSKKTIGTGLGLHIAQKLIKMHGGEIWAESLGKNKGSTFYINLPIK